MELSAACSRPSDVEVIADAAPEIAEACRLLKQLSPEGLARLEKPPRVGDEKGFKRLLDREPEGEAERPHTLEGRFRAPFAVPAERGEVTMEGRFRLRRQ